MSGFLRKKTRNDLPVRLFDCRSFKGDVQDCFEQPGKGKISVLFSRAAPHREAAGPAAPGPEHFDSLVDLTAELRRHGPVKNQFMRFSDRGPGNRGAARGEGTLFKNPVILQKSLEGAGRDGKSVGHVDCELVLYFGEVAVLASHGFYHISGNVFIRYNKRLGNRSRIVDHTPELSVYSRECVMQFGISVLRKHVEAGKRVIHGTGEAVRGVFEVLDIEEIVPAQLLHDVPCRLLLTMHRIGRHQRRHPAARALSAYFAVHA
jgi:hypothetical protein